MNKILSLLVFTLLISISNSTVYAESAQKTQIDTAKRAVAAVEASDKAKEEQAEEVEEAIKEEVPAEDDAD